MPDQYVQLEYELLYSKLHTEMHVYDELGRKVSSYTLGENTRGVEILDTRKLVGGLYIVEIARRETDFLQQNNRTALMRLFCLAIISLLWAWNIQAQSTIAYTVDSDLNTQETLRSETSVFDIYPLEDGGFFLGGRFNTTFTNPTSPFSKGIAMINDAGGVHPDWEDGIVSFAREIMLHEGSYLFATGETLLKLTQNGISWYFFDGDNWGDYYLFGEWGSGFVNPYNVRWTWDIFILEDQSVLIGGAIATDTIQPSLFRHLMRLLPDGSHDTDFPIVEAMPQGLFTHISKIERAADGSWYVSGRFEGINGHISPHIAKLNADFSVDTDFVSPFVYESWCCGLHTELKLLDSQDRLWFGGEQIRLESNPNDTLHLVRLLSDGTVDPTFASGKIDSRNWGFSFEKPPFINGVVERDHGDFFIHGSFSHYNDSEQLCISVLDDEGIIQENYFNGLGATINYFDPDDPTNVSRPNAHALEILDDGSLMIGGAFSDFMGVERYSMVKLNQGTVSTRDQNRLEGKIKVYPNPARDRVTVQLVTSAHFESAQWPGGSGRIESLRITDLSGRTVASFPWNGDNASYDVSHLAKGVYVVQIMDSDTVIGLEKLVIH
ncbi:MAG: hypothetical protein ACJAQ4_000345 [Cryomorphaceae bacterium]|jgi:hypothetical protein